MTLFKTSSPRCLKSSPVPKAFIFRGFFAEIAEAAPKRIAIRTISRLTMMVAIQKPKIWCINWGAWFVSAPFANLDDKVNQTFNWKISFNQVFMHMYTDNLLEASLKEQSNDLRIILCTLVLAESKWSKRISTRSFERPRGSALDGT